MLMTLFKIHLVFDLLLFLGWLYTKCWISAHPIESMEISIRTRKTPLWMCIVIWGFAFAIITGVLLGIAFIIASI